MRWARPTAGWHCAQSGIRGVVNLLGKVPNKQSVDKLECWIWDQVYSLSAIPVLSLAMCMVLDVVSPVNGRRCHQNCWAGALVANLLAALGVARLRVASRYVHPPRWACRVLRMLPPRWLQEVSQAFVLYTLQIRETFAKEGVLGPINLFEWKRVGLLIMYLCCHRPFLCSPPWFRDSLARFWYFVPDHIDEFVVKPSAVVRKNIGLFPSETSIAWPVCSPVPCPW